MATAAWSLYTSYTESFRPNTSIANAIGDLPPEKLASASALGFDPDDPAPGACAAATTTLRHALF